MLHNVVNTIAVWHLRMDKPPEYSVEHDYIHAWPEFTKIFQYTELSKDYLKDKTSV